MNLTANSAPIALALHVLVELVLIVRVLLRAHRQPAARMAWIVVIAALPVLGILGYLLFGEVNIGRRRVARLRDVLRDIPAFPPASPGDTANLAASIPEQYAHLFRFGCSISRFEPVGGNAARLIADSNAAIDAMVADIDAAGDHVHVLFYIWLPGPQWLPRRRGVEMCGGARREVPRPYRSNANQK
jgi:cardiolipin synthase A/B